MNDKLRIFSKPGIVVEAIAIVVSILFAFAIDAWWDARAEARKSNSQLETIREELASIGEAITYSRSDLEQLRIAVIDILRHIGPETTLISSEELFELIDFSFRAQTIELEAGSITALLASGELSSLENIELKSNLASWQRRVTSIRNKSGQLEANREIIIEYLHDKLPTLNIAQKTGQMTRYPLSDFEAEPALFQRDMKLEGLFANRGMLIEDTEIYLAEVQEAVGQILHHIGTP